MYKHQYSHINQKNDFKIMKRIVHVNISSSDDDSDPDDLFALDKSNGKHSEVYYKTESLNIQ